MTEARARTPAVTEVPASLPRSRDFQLGLSYWGLTALLAGAALAAAVIGVALDDHFPGLGSHVPVPLRLSPADAQTVLALIGGASITVVALVVALTMLVLSLAATSFGPCLVQNYIRLKSARLTIAAFVATFVYTLVVLTLVYSGPGREFTPLLSTWMAVVYVLVSTGLLVWWVQDVAHSIQVGNLITTIVGYLYRAIAAEERAAAQLPNCDRGPAEPVPGSIAGCQPRQRLLAEARPRAAPAGGRGGRRSALYRPCSRRLRPRRPPIGEGGAAGAVRGSRGRGLCCRHPGLPPDPGAGPRLRRGHPGRDRCAGTVAGGKRPSHRDDVR